MMKRVAVLGTVLMTGLILGACGQQTTSKSTDNTDQSSVSVSLKKRESRVAKREKQVSKASSRLAASQSQSDATTESTTSSATSEQSSVATTTSSATATNSSTAATSQTPTTSQSTSKTTSTSGTQNTNPTTPTQPTTIDGNQAIKLVVQQAGQKFGQSASYLNNGLITREGQQGYLINIYAPNEDAPRAGYFVTQTGQVEQIW